MKQLSTRTIAIIALVAVAVIGMGALAFQDKLNSLTSEVVREAATVVGKRNKNNEQSMEIEGGVKSPNNSPYDNPSSWGEYKNEKYGISIRHPREWIIESDGDGSFLSISWQNNSISLFPLGTVEPSCYQRGQEGEFEKIIIGGYEDELYTRTMSDGMMYSCTPDLDNYPRSWNDSSRIEMRYESSLTDTMKKLLRGISFLEDTIDKASLELYGERVGMDESVAIHTSNWNTERNDLVNFSFRYPDSAEIINEGNCYRVEYRLGFVIFFLPIEGGNRCSARTGVGILPDNVNVTDNLIVDGETYEAPGFHIVVDTQGETSYNPKTRYFYDFHYMFDFNKEENCGNAGGCMRVGYGIYKETETPLDREKLNITMDTLRAIVESVEYKD